MRFPQILFLTGSCLYFFASCKKNENGSLLSKCDNIKQVIKHGVYGRQAVTETIMHDEKGRVKSVAGAERDKSFYEYYNNRIVLTATDISGNDISLVYFLDE